MGEMADNDAFYAELLADSLIRESQANIRCTRCHTSNLQWALFDDKWKLINKDGSPHKCKAHKKGTKQ